MQDWLPGDRKLNQFWLWREGDLTWNLTMKWYDIIWKLTSFDCDEKWYDMKLNNEMIWYET